MDADFSNRPEDTKMPELSELTVGEYLKRAASDAPVPGGGSAAALVAALGCAMASMSANFTAGRPKYAGVEAEISGMLTDFSAGLAAMAGAIDADAGAFAAIAEAYRLPKETEEEKAARKRAVQAALRGAMLAPRRLIGNIGAVSVHLARLAEIGNPNLVSDTGVAAAALSAAACAARLNVLVNAKQLPEDETAGILGEMEDDCRRIHENCGKALAAAEKRMLS